MVLPRTRAVHTLGMRFADRRGLLRRGHRGRTGPRLRALAGGMPCRQGRLVVEAKAGVVRAWGLPVGDHLELR